MATALSATALSAIDLELAALEQRLDRSGVQWKAETFDAIPSGRRGVVFIELPEVGKAVKAGGEAAVVESVKAASDVYAPVTGEVVAVNAVLSDAPETVNAQPYDDGWMVQVRIAGAPEGTLDAAGYRALIGE